MNGSEGAAHDAGGEEAEVDGGEEAGDGVPSASQRLDRSQMLRDPGARAFDPRVPVGLGELTVAVASHGDGAFVCHSHYFSG